MAMVSVIIPVFNREETIARTIASVKAQRFTDIECAIVDDGSTDNSAEIIKNAISDDDRFSYHYQENQGVATARNNGVFLYTSAPFVMCLDSDDQIEPDYIGGLLPHLVADRRVGIAYTKLVLVYKNGQRKVSHWPHEFDARTMFDGQNLIPTAALTTRKMWEMLGGQRKRFEGPGGAGAEDGDFWLRAVSRGFEAKYVPLQEGAHFLYNGDGGTVYRNKDYVPADYYAWSPWSKRHALMPGPSIYPPRDFSHAIKWYDSPPITVIVAVGPRHMNEMVNALDSLDAQTFQDFQVVVVFDVDEETWQAAVDNRTTRYIADTWPGCWFTSTAANGLRARELTSKLRADIEGISILDRLPAGQPAGPARARNIGLGMTDTPLVFFLDADDWIVPDALEKMYKEYLATGKVIFSDHIGVAHIAEKDLASVDGKVVGYDTRKGIAYVEQTISDYRCELAQRQPTLDGKPPYVICNVSSLVPRRYINKVGGFDENIASWEDVLLFWQLAWSGVCFKRIPEPLLVYRYFTGFMRERGLEQAADLLKYIKEVSDRTEKMGCGCNDKKPLVQQTEAAGMSANTLRLKLSRGSHVEVSDSEVVMIELQPRQDGDIQRFGQYDFGGGNRVAYGPRRKGDRFLALEKDVIAEESLARAQNREPEFVRIEGVVRGIPEDIEEPQPPPVVEEVPDEINDVWGVEEEVEEEVQESVFPEPVPGGRGMDVKDLELGLLKNPERAIAILLSNDISTVGEMLDYDVEWEEYGGLTHLEGVGPKTREALLSAASKVV